MIEPRTMPCATPTASCLMRKSSTWSNWKTSALHSLRHVGREARHRL